VAARSSRHLGSERRGNPPGSCQQQLRECNRRRHVVPERHRTVANTWEQFEVINNANGTISLRATVSSNLSPPT